jgi:hypothetical protein
MRDYIITYKVKERTWTTKKTIVQAYDKDHARDKFNLWKGLIIKIEKA